MSEVQLQAAHGQRRWWALAALAMSVLVVGLDLFVLSLALPTLAVKLHASTGDLQWFVDAYSLVLAAAMLPAGLLGDRIGRKRLLMGALVLFGIASLACAYSTSTGELIAARALLGLAAAVIMPLALAVLPVMFTPEERPKAIGIVGGATFIGYPIGPILGGWLLDNYWWGSVFLINVPIVVLALLAVLFLMPESRGTSRFRIDVTGVVISSAGLAALTYGLIRAGQEGWSDAGTISAIAAGAIVLAVFVAWERTVARRGSQPLVDLSLFSSAGFTWGTTLATMISFALFGLTFAMPQFFLDVKGVDSLGSGVRMLPLIGGIAVGLIVGQRLQSTRKSRNEQSDKPPLLGARGIGATGFAVIAIALVVGTRTTAASSTAFLAAWFAVTGVGLGMALPTMLNAALSALTPERSGSGSALMTAARQVGATIGVAVLGTVLASAYQSHLSVSSLSSGVAAAAKSSVGTGVAVATKLGSAPLLSAVRDAYASGVDLMLWVCAAIAIAAAVLAVLFLPRQVAGSADAAVSPADVAVSPVDEADSPADEAVSPAGVAGPDTGPAGAE